MKKLTKYLVVEIVSYLHPNEIFINMTKLSKTFRKFLDEQRNIGITKRLIIRIPDEDHKNSDISYLINFCDEIHIRSHNVLTMNYQVSLEYFLTHVVQETNIRYISIAYRDEYKVSIKKLLYLLNLLSETVRI